MTRIRLAAPLLAAFLLTAAPLAASADSLNDAREYLREGQNDRALQAVDSYLASHANSPEARLLKGAVLARLGRSTEAAQVYTALIRDYPALPEPRNNLAVLYASLGQYDKARAELEAALRTHPSYAAAYDNLGEVYAKMASLAYDRALGDKKPKTAPPASQLALMTNIPRPGTRTEPLRVAMALPSAPQAFPPAKPLVIAAATAVAKPVPAAPPPAAQPAGASQPGLIPPAPEAVAKTPAATAAVKPLPPAEPPVAKPAEKPVEKPAAKPEADESEAVIAAVHGWAQAWSSQNVAAYLGHYARDFRTPKGESRASWEKTRRDRITAPKTIKVTITSPKVRLDKDGLHASVTFRQGYEAGHLVNATTKTLEMVKAGKRWLIEEERIGR
ncbi:MAG: tetratricopeptide repeat protein [Sulfuricellaceae bacterium]|jgi:tetratricopeptide (TPR) repeat protein